MGSRTLTRPLQVDERLQPGLRGLGGPCGRRLTEHHGPYGGSAPPPPLCCRTPADLSPPRPHTPSPAHHAAFWMPRMCAGGAGSHHGQLGLQLLHPVVLKVQLGAQRRGMVRGLLGLAPQLPLLTLQQVLLLCQGFDGIFALLQGQSARPLQRGRGASSWRGHRGLDPWTRGR